MSASTGVRAAIRSKSSIVNVEAELARDRQQVQEAVGRAARGDDRRGGVLDRLPRDDLRRPHVAPDEVDDEPAALVRRLALCFESAGIAVEPGGLEAEELEDRSTSCSR